MQHILKDILQNFLTSQSSVLNNEELEVDFRLLIASLSSAKGASNSEVVGGLFKALVSKLANTRIYKFMKAKVKKP